MNDSILGMDPASVGTSVDKLFRGRNRVLALRLLGVFDDLREWWPLTVRQAYYQAVSRQVIGNKLSEYKRVSRVLVDLRREELLPWKAIEDRSRRTIDKRGVPEVAGWLREQLEDVFDPAYYGRCYLQDQAVYVEVSLEKDALTSIVEEAVWMYCTRINIGRGRLSQTMLNNVAERFDKAIMLGKEPILLHFGDLDPTGVSIPKTLARQFAEEKSIDVDVRHVALTPEQVQQYGLPPSLDAAKKSDPNFKAWARKYGADMKPVELDALHPEQLQALVREALEDVYDMTEVLEQREIEIQERAEIKRIRHAVQDFAARRFPEYFAP